ncbi:hypothetical protein HYH03_003743 [Edaphochlamys debaryana]|uniref:Uncharacterized protein n=1 Tax=Edaphochlamys debaryana TaxID=47281 RepID=A0A836C2X4_9CHLO|nr:hypothetical protein HYH03_003743 [Edaphochlamys debaryana]|eukprot:KAG2498491.1 hypothetical protein HYH03_003743 [Edaphochlamys debaryana]
MAGEQPGESDVASPAVTAAKLAVGAVAAAASRHYFKKRQLWAWRISTLVAWPALGLGIMDLAIGWQAPKQAIVKKVEDARSSQA